MKRIVVLLSLLTVFSIQAKVIAVVSGIKGKAFLTHGGKTKMLRSGMHIPAQSEIFTDLGAQLSINDYYDHVYHLAGGGHMMIHTNLVDLKEGYLWVKSLNYDPVKGPFRVITTNSVVEHQKGEGIVSFDVYTGKTQVLAVQGSFDIRNTRQEHYQLELAEGQFSFISNDYENGRPRRPTPIGYSSFKKVTGLFQGVEPFSKGGAKNTRPMRKMARSVSKRIPRAKKVKATTSSNDLFESALSQRKRGVASVQDASEGKTIVLKLHQPQSTAEKEQTLMQYYNSKIGMLRPKKMPKKKWRPGYQKKSDVTVRIFGKGMKSSSRIPASVAPVSAPSKMKIKVRPKMMPRTVHKEEMKMKTTRTPASIGGMTPTINKNAFDSEMIKQYKKQMRHEREVNELIDQLKSIDMDYQKEY